MRGTAEDETGELGVDAISFDFRRIHWSPVVNSRGDLGTDLFVQVRDERRFSLGLVVGAQAKTGPTWFDDPVHDANGTLVGWWFYEPDKRHFDEWVEHGLPHLVVLHDLDKRASYWVHVTAANAQSTGKGCKVLVPATQTIDPAHAADLIQVAATMRQGISLQGTAWTADGLPIGPGSLLRHAMIAPRLVAPHPNTSVDKLTPEQALALIVQGRHFDLNQYINRVKAVPTIADAAKPSSDWRWQLVAAMWTYTTAGDGGELTRLAGSAATAPHRAVGTIAAACSAMDDERFEDAIELLSAELERAEPVDCAWLLAQRARVRSDLGLVTEARQDAARAQRCVVHASDDVTAAAIRAAAGQLLFQTSAWNDRSVGTLVEANDTAVSWWRGQTMATGLVNAAERQFRRHTDDTAVTIGGIDVAHNTLFAVQLSAHLTGEHGTWRSAASLLSQHVLMFWEPDNGIDQYASALDDLRRAGDRKHLQLAAVRTWRAGPVAALADAVRRGHDAPWTHTNTGTKLLLWQHGGDVLSVDLATAGAEWCLDVLADPGALTTVALPFRIDSLGQGALAGLLPVADGAVHRRTVEMLSRLPEDAGPGEVADMVRCVRALRSAALTDEDLTRLREIPRRLREPHLATAVVGALARLDAALQRQLIDQIAAGDVAALRAFDGNDLPPAAATQAIRLAAEHVGNIVKQTRAHEFRQGDWDPAAELAMWNCRHPDAADWGTLLSLLAEPAAPGHYKRHAFLTLAAGVEHVPEFVQADLRSIAENFAEPPNPYGVLLGESTGGAVTHLAIALGTFDSARHADAVSRLLTGTVQERQDFARYIASGDPVRFGPALLALLGDPDVQVRARAANSVAKAAREHDDALLCAALRRAVADPGALVPMAAAAGLKGALPLRLDLAEVLNGLLDHPSYKVRTVIRAALHAESVEPVG
jgi:hypothetical protein